ncbi:hypothetical protein EDD18DRAFT_1431021 [Armillaria luteobubalina]|uniref:Uncharacterized protein n=1 Tax=Armillaria luteobubalina TaxID=153913 RepID=A0AA39QG73_9AGAR|nr:hypothetical protein EDD18DRAFT_1431021 [Armillaria luteobubalina]
MPHKYSSPSAAGSINFGLQHLKDSTSETLTSDNLKIANLVIDRLNVENKQFAMPMSEFAIKWKDFEMWKHIVKATAFDLPAYGLDGLVNAWQTFTFEDICPV